MSQASVFQKIQTSKDGLAETLGQGLSVAEGDRYKVDTLQEVGTGPC
jgi:hypothetical protein